MASTIAAPSQRVMFGGRLVLTRGISDWVATGVEPWADEPNPDTYPLDWRRHTIAVIVTSHLNGDQLDTSPDDHALNQATFASPGEGGRIVNVWHRNGTAKIYCITDDYGGASAVTTVMFSSEY